MPDAKSPRRSVNIPVVIEKVSGEPVELEAALEQVYERVVPDSDDLGARFVGAITELALNGAFVAGPALPLLSRIVLSFALPGGVQVCALGWVMWRRTATVTIEPGGHEAEAMAGIGVMFEHLPMPAQQVLLAMA